MAGLIGAHHLVGGIFHMAAHVSHGGVDHALMRRNLASGPQKHPAAKVAILSAPSVSSMKCGGRPCDGRPPLFLHFDGIYDLDFGEPEQTPRPVLHADSRPLRAAERQIGRDRQMLIDPCRSGIRAARRLRPPCSCRSTTPTADSPYLVELARRTASSTSLYAMIGSAGPNCSSSTSRTPSEMFPTMVG